MLPLSLCFVCAMDAMETRTPSPVAALFNDALTYRMIDVPGKPKYRHRLDPGPHELTVGQFVEQLMAGEADWANFTDDGAPWYQEFTERDKFLMALGAYYHDVGKFGVDLHECTFDGGKVVFSGRSGHELIGFYYALVGLLDEDSLRAVRQRLHDFYGINVSCLHEYILLSGKPMNNIFQGLGLTPDEQRLVAVLIGAHKAFTQVCENDSEFSAVLESFHPILPEEFLAFLRDLKIMAGLCPDIDKKLLDMVIALTLADSRAVLFTVERFVPSQVIGDEYAEFLGARRNSLHEGEFFVEGKEWPGGERAFHVWLNVTFVALARQYRKIILGLLTKSLV